MSRRSGIVADGRKRISQAIRARYRKLYLERARKLSLLGRLRLRLQLQQQLRSELDRLAPPGASYLTRR